MSRIWYFAYGSNLDPGTFVNRRAMRPADALVARLDNYRLVFDLPVGPGERGVANLKPHVGARVYGVAYSLTDDEFAKLDRTEGVHRGFYRRAPVTVKTIDSHALNTFTYLSDHRAEGRRPSERYLELLLAGARHHGLPPEYTAELDGLERAIDERP